MKRSERIRAAIDRNALPVYQGRAVGTSAQLARIAEVPSSTVRYACYVRNVRTYLLDGTVMLIDALDLAEHFRRAKPGRKLLLNNASCVQA